MSGGADKMDFVGHLRADLFKCEDCASWHIEMNFEPDCDYEVYGVDCYVPLTVFDSEDEAYSWLDAQAETYLQKFEIH